MTLFLSFSPHFQGCCSLAQRCFISISRVKNFQKFQNPNSKKSLTQKNWTWNTKVDFFKFQTVENHRNRLKNISKQLFSWVLWILNSRICTWRTWVTCNESIMMIHASSCISKQHQNNYHTLKAVEHNAFSYCSEFLIIYNQKQYSLYFYWNSLFRWIMNNDSEWFIYRDRNSSDSAQWICEETPDSCWNWKISDRFFKESF